MNNSTLRTLTILELLAENAPLTVSEISKQLNIPKTSAFDILAALTQRGFAKADEFHRYTLGLATYRVGMSYIGSADLYTAGHHRLQQLSRQLEQTVYLAAEDQGWVVYLDKAEQDSPIRFTRRVGDRNRLYLTGLGKAILAARPALTAALPYPLTPKTKTTLCTQADLLADLENTKKRGYALDMGEDNELLRCVAVPILDRDGTAIGAVSCSMLAPEFARQDVQTIATALTAAALDISHSLGYTGNALY